MVSTTVGRMIVRQSTARHPASRNIVSRILLREITVREQRESTVNVGFAFKGVGPARLPEATFAEFLAQTSSRIFCVSMLDPFVESPSGPSCEFVKNAYPQIDNPEIIILRETDGFRHTELEEGSSAKEEVYPNDGLSLISNVLSSHDCSERDELVYIDQRSDTPIILNALQAAYNTWPLKVQRDFDPSYKKIEKISYSGDSDVDIINGLIDVFTQYKSNDPVKRQILWHVQLIGWEGTIEDFIKCGKATKPDVQRRKRKTGEEKKSGKQEQLIGVIAQAKKNTKVPPGKPTTTSITSTPISTGISGQTTLSSSSQATSVPPISTSVLTQTTSSVVTIAPSLATSGSYQTTAEPLATTTELEVTTIAPTETTLEEFVTTFEPSQATTQSSQATSQQSQATSESSVLTAEPVETTAEKAETTAELSQTTVMPVETTAEASQATYEASQTTSESSVPTFEPSQTTAEPAATTAEPSQATAETVVTTSEPVETTAEPVETTSEPVETTAEPAVTTSEPEETTAEPVVTTSEPVETTAEPVETTAEPAETTAEPSQATAEPVVTTSEPEETTAEPSQATAEPVVTTSEPVETTAEPVETTSEPVETTAEPVETTAEPAVTTSEPTETTAEPAVTTSEPSQTTAEPAKTTAEPSQATAEPVETTAEPVETTAEPAVTTSEPTETTAEPAVTTSEPTETTAEPAVTTSEPEETTAEPVLTTSEPVEITVEPAVTTSEPMETTAQQAETTAEPSHATSEPAVTTSETVEVTSEPVETTSEPSMPTVAPVETTAQQAESTAELVEITAKPAVTTSEPEETTAEPSQATSEQSQATSESSVSTFEPSQTTAEPSQATAEPVVTTSEPVEITAEPAVTTSEPEETTAEPAEITSELSQTTSESTVTTSEAAEVTTAPSQTTSEPSVPTLEPVETTAEPAEITSEPSQTTSEPAVTTSETVEVTSEPSQTTSELSQGTAEPSVPTSEPVQTTSELSQTTSEPTVTTSETFEVTSEPSQTTSEPSQATAETTVTTSETFEITSEPSQTTSEPSQTTSEPTVTTSETAEFTTGPSQTTSEPSVPTLEPVETTAEQAENTSETAEVTTGPFQATAEPSLPTVQPAETTAEPAETTAVQAETTAELSQTTSEQSQATAEPSVTSLEPVETTAEQAETTSEPPQATAEPAVTTSETAEVTTEPSQATAEPSLPTVQPAETTAEQAETTAEAVEVTSEPSQTTSEQSQTTSEPSVPTFEPAETTAELSQTTAEPAVTTSETAEFTTGPSQSTSELSQATVERSVPTFEPVETTSEFPAESTFEPSESTFEPFEQSEGTSYFASETSASPESNTEPSTQEPGSSPSTMICSAQYPNTSAIILNNQDTQISTYMYDEMCVICNRSSDYVSVKKYYTSAENAIPQPSTAVVIAQCMASSPFCMCTESGECFHFLFGYSSSTVRFHSYCDGSTTGTMECHMYAVVDDPFGFGWLTGDQGTMFNPSSQQDGSGNYYTMGSNSPYLKAISVSCEGCAAIKNPPPCPPSIITDCEVEPENTPSLILDNADIAQVQWGNPVETCWQCNSGLTAGAKNYYEPVVNAYPDVNNEMPKAQCRDKSQFCMCTESGECFQQLGNTLYSVNFYSYCDGANSLQCHMYALVSDSLDGSSGLIGDQGTIFISRTQYDENFNPLPMGSSSPYLKAVSVSCSGCDSIRDATCGSNVSTVELYESTFEPTELSEGTSISVDEASTSSEPNPESTEPSTQEPGSSPSTMVCSAQYPNTSSIILNNQDTQISTYMYDEMCVICNRSNDYVSVKKYYTSSENAIPQPSTAVVNMHCIDMNKFCMCTESGECFHFFTSSPSSTARFHSYCDESTAGSAECHMYAVVDDPYYFGLIGDQGTMFMPSSQQDGSGNYYAMGSNSPYLKTVSVSCDGCAVIKNPPPCPSSIITDCEVEPENTPSLILDNADIVQVQWGNPVETCWQCDSGLSFGAKNYYTPVANAYPNVNIEMPKAECRDKSQFCMCIESGECFQQLGNTLYSVNFYSYCDGAEPIQCHMYALVSNSLDGASGLVGDQGTIFISRTQYDENFNPLPMGSSSPYLKAVSVSCSGCDSIRDATCGSNVTERSPATGGLPLTPTYSPLTESFSTGINTEPFTGESASSQMTQQGTSEFTPEPTTSQICFRPENTAAIVVEGGNTQIYQYPPEQAGTCSDCSADSVVQSYYSSLPNANPGQTPSVNAECMANKAGFCMCTESGECFQQLGNSLGWVNFYPLCDGDSPEQCHMYAFVYDFFDGSSGLMGDQGTVFLSTSQLNANGTDYLPMGSDSAYLKAVSVSCEGCTAIKNATCASPMIICPIQPANTAPLILDSTETYVNISVPVENCTSWCSGGPGTKFFYASVTTTIPQHAVASASAHCMDMNQFCMCTESGECFHQFGNTLSTVNFYAFCDMLNSGPDQCHTYAYVIDAYDGSSGLIGDQGTVFYSTSQFPAPMMTDSLGSNSVYLKATSASCRGCAVAKSIWTCGSIATDGPITLSSAASFETTEPSLETSELSEGTFSFGDETTASPESSATSFEPTETMFETTSELQEGTSSFGDETTASPESSDATTDSFALTISEEPSSDLVTYGSTLMSTAGQFCPQPANTASLLVDSADPQINVWSFWNIIFWIYTGSCTACISGLQAGVQYYWPSVPSSNPSPLQNIAAVGVQCQNMNNFCMCTESGECFQPFGGTILAVNLYSFCDGADPLECHMYAFLIDFERTSGLYGDQGTFFMSTSQDDAFGNYHPMGSNSLYLKATSVSCDGCAVISNATCAPPGTAVPSTTAVSTVSTGLPTITPGDGVCLQPANTSSLLLDSADSQISIFSFDNIIFWRHVGSCTECNSGLQMGTQYYWPSVLYNPTPLQSIAAVGVNCQNMSNFCMCTESGECFQPFGQSLVAVILYSFCDGADPVECHMYAFLLDFEKTSGLYGDQGTFFMSTSQDDAFGNYHPMGSNSIYLKATSVSCDGCAVIENATCAPPGTAVPSTTAVSTVSTGLPTITPGDGVCLQPANTASLLVDSADSQIYIWSIWNIIFQIHTGSCTECNSGLQMGTQYYWPSVLSPNPSPSQNIAAVSVQCQNMSNFCMCTESGECFQPFGQSLLAVNLYSFCDGADPLECHMYAFLIDFERTSGLYGDQGTFFMSTSQDDAFGNYHPMGSNSIYLKATSVSCDGCVVINNATCAPPGTAVPSTTAVSTVSTGFPTITPGCTQPINTSLLILDTADTDIHHGIPTKSCNPCSSGGAIGNKFYYSSVPSANSENDIESASAHCININQFCMCTESGECFQQMGNTLNAVSFYSFCDGGITPFPECHTYAIVMDAFDGSSGLIGDNGTIFISTSQIDANGNLLPMGPNSIYLKATAASCRGCVATRGIWTCGSPTTSGSPVTGGPVTIVSDVTFETTEPLP